jgi:hypothetical protein
MTFNKFINNCSDYTTIRVRGIGYKSGFDVTCLVRDVTISEDDRVTIKNPVGTTAAFLHTIVKEITSFESVWQAKKDSWTMWLMDDDGYSIKCRD